MAEKEKPVDVEKKEEVTTTGGTDRPQSVVLAGTLRSGRKLLDPPKKVPQKKPRTTIIDDEVACLLLQELRVNKAFYNSGRVLAWALPPDDPVFAHIYDYVAQGQAHGYGLKVQSIIRIISKIDPMGHPVPLDFQDDPNAKGKLRMMLWHGTKKDVVANILATGLRLPMANGQMFGPGLYFADRISKSYGYTHYRNWVNNAVAYMLLCDVLIGEMYETEFALPDIRAPPSKPVPGGAVQCDSVMGCGEKIPDPKGNKEIDGCIWPLGPTVGRSVDRFSSRRLNFNEFVVYKTEQVQPKYLVKVRIQPKPVFEKLF